jgi:hypothetical protein
VKEFWIYFTEMSHATVVHKLSRLTPKAQEKAIHVVEKSAYDELEAKLARIENVVREMKCSVHIEKDALAVAYLFRALCALVDKERG